jgi:hypothetical protein
MQPEHTSDLGVKPKAIDSNDIGFWDSLKTTSLPARFWLPTLFSVFAGAVLLIWFIYFNLFRPLDNAIVEIKNKGEAGRLERLPSILHTVFLEGTTGESLSGNQRVAISNVVFRLKQRDDLVLIVAGYTNNDVRIDQFQKQKDSKKTAELIRNIVVAQGIDPRRIYFEGFGQNVPYGFPIGQASNAGLFVVDVVELMKAYRENGSVISAI